MCVSLGIQRADMGKGLGGERCQACAHREDFSEPVFLETAARVCVASPHWTQKQIRDAPTRLKLGNIFTP